MSVSATVQFTFTATDTRTYGLSPPVGIPLNLTPNLQFGNGTGAGNFQVLWHLPRTLGASADLLNFFSGTLVDGWGTTVAATSAKGLFVQNTGTANIVLGAAATNPWTGLFNATGTFTMLPGDIFMVASPTSVSGWTFSATSTTLSVAGTNGQTYSIALLALGT